MATSDDRYGDTAVTRRRAGTLRESADDVRAAADQLAARMDALAWRGRAATSMRHRVAERARRLREAAAGFETAAESLARHAGAVDDVHDAIADRERRGHALVAAARERVAHLQPGVDPDHADAALTAADLPPAGHRGWLTV